MSLMTRFEHGAIRKGFILEEVSWNLCLCKRVVFLKCDFFVPWFLHYHARPSDWL